MTKNYNEKAGRSRFKGTTTVSASLVNEIKKELGVEHLRDIQASNILNMKVRDIEDIDLGRKELSLKDISIICNFYSINPDILFDKIRRKR